MYKKIQSTLLPLLMLEQVLFNLASDRKTTPLSVSVSDINVTIQFQYSHHIAGIL